MLILVALAALGFGAYCLSRIYDGLRTGEMPLILNTRSIYFFRKFEPILFWGAATFNGFLAAVCLGASATLLVQGLSRK